VARRYAISGRDHTGKTTICHAVTARLRAQGVDADMVDEQSRRSVALAEGRRGITTQLDLFARTVVVELEVARSSEVVVCDRSLVDILGYTDLLDADPESEGPTDLAMRKAMDAFAEHFLATYAAIFVPSWSLEAVDDDPLRAPVRHRQDELAAHIERRLAPYADRVVRLDDQATAVDAVVGHVLRDLNRL
jgi:AAA domain-containing protein